VLQASMVTTVAIGLGGVIVARAVGLTWRGEIRRHLWRLSDNPLAGTISAESDHGGCCSPWAVAE
jgi:hypothetical protein